MLRNLLSLTVCGLAVLSLSACASRPKPPPGPTLADTPSPAIPQDNPTPSASSGEAAARGQADLAARAGDRIYFGFDSHTLEPEARDVLVRQAAWLASNGDVSAIIAGSADERGTREYNLALGARRAAAAREVLVANGVDPGRLQTLSYGKEQPLDPASNEDAWARNRNAHTQLQPGR